MLEVAEVWVLRLVAWTNVGVALALLVAVVLWLACCVLESRRDAKEVRAI